MSERRSLRSAKDVTLHEMLGDTTRRSSTPTKKSSLQNAPDITESSDTDRRGSRGIRSRKIRQQEVDLTLDIENNNSLLNSSNVPADNLNTIFEDTPAHLYGLDNPDNISSVKEKESNREVKSHQNVQANTKNKICYQICYALFILVVIALIGWLLQHASLYIQPKEEDCLAQCQNGELAAEFKKLRERVVKLEHERRNLVNPWNLMFSRANDYAKKVPSYQNVFLDDKSFKCSGKDLDKLFSSRIEQALNRWDADKIGIPDFALESSGGQIHSAYHSATFSNGAPQLLVFGIPLWYEVKTPRVIIQPGNAPGDCWAFQGKEGFVVIKLSQMIKPSSFTLEHMAASLSQFGDNSIPSAPKDFSVWGWSDAHGKEKTKLGEYVYDNEGTALQTFSVQVSTALNFRFIELRVHSNYGNPSYTCLYRFRVHGSPYKNNN